MEGKIPYVTARRLPLYYRYLEILHKMGKQRVSSAELSEALLIDPATIRRDFSYLGELGKKGYGYNVAYLVEFLLEFLRQDEPTNVVLIGVGNLGTAFCRYTVYRNNQTKIIAAFDIDPLKVGQDIDGVPIYSIKELPTFVQTKNVEAGILAVPAPSAQATADEMVAAGIRGILNFTPRPLSMPNHIRVHHIDLTMELQMLIYFLKKYPGEINTDDTPFFGR